MDDTVIRLRHAFVRLAVGAIMTVPLACQAEAPAGAAPEAAAESAPAEAPVAQSPASPETVQVAMADGEKPYDVECVENAEGARECAVDKATFVGWRTYHAFCHVCHAQDAVGSTFAPSLVDRMTQIDKARFIESVAEGYTGQIGVMPGWKDNPNISKRYEELYAYLMARADGALAPGRPEKKKAPQ